MCALAAEFSRFMMLMIVIRSKDPRKKLQYSFAMHDTNGSGKLEKDEFTMLCLRAMRMSGVHDFEVRIQRMLPGASVDDLNTVAYFFSHMNAWFRRKMDNAEGHETGAATFDSPPPTRPAPWERETQSRGAEKVEGKAAFKDAH